MVEQRETKVVDGRTLTPSEQIRIEVDRQSRSRAVQGYWFEYATVGEKLHLEKIEGDFEGVFVKRMREGETVTLQIPSIVGSVSAEVWDTLSKITAQYQKGLILKLGVGATQILPRDRLVFSEQTEKEFRNNLSFVLRFSEEVSHIKTDILSNALYGYSLICTRIEVEDEEDFIVLTTDEHFVLCELEYRDASAEELIGVRNVSQTSYVKLYMIFKHLFNYAKEVIDKNGAKGIENIFSNEFLREVWCDVLPKENTVELRLCVEEAVLEQTNKRTEIDWYAEQKAIVGLLREGFAEYKRSPLYVKQTHETRKMTWLNVMAGQNEYSTELHYRDFGVDFKILSEDIRLLVEYLGMDVIGVVERLRKHGKDLVKNWFTFEKECKDFGYCNSLSVLKNNKSSKEDIIQEADRLGFSFDVVHSYFDDLVSVILGGWLDDVEKPNYWYADEFTNPMLAQQAKERVYKKYTLNAKEQKDMSVTERVIYRICATMNLTRVHWRTIQLLKKSLGRGSVITTQEYINRRRAEHIQSAIMVIHAWVMRVFGSAYDNQLRINLDGSVTQEEQEIAKAIYRNYMRLETKMEHFGATIDEVPSDEDEYDKLMEYEANVSTVDNTYWVRSSKLYRGLVYGAQDSLKGLQLSVWEENCPSDKSNTYKDFKETLIKNVLEVFANNASHLFVSKPEYYKQAKEGYKEHIETVGKMFSEMYGVYVLDDGRLSIRIPNLGAWYLDLLNAAAKGEELGEVSEQYVRDMYMLEINEESR